MNIFHLSRDLELSARYHCNSHVCKMLVEYVQLLSAANRLSGLDEGYKLTHKNHPCAVWIRESVDNWKYLRDLTSELNKEFKYRFKHSANHKSFEMMQSLSVPKLPRIGLTVPPKCMPDDAKVDGVIASYRNYYRIHKQHILCYTGRPLPKFLKL